MFRYWKQSCVLSACILASGCMPEMGLTNALTAGQTERDRPRVESLNPVVTQAPLCSAVIYAGLKGQPAAAADSVAEPKRVIPVGSVVTTDHNPSRTNVDLDDSGKISRVWCG